MTTYRVTFRTPGGTYGAIDFECAHGFDVRRMFALTMKAHGYSKQCFTWSCHYQRL
jgi:hypothetical protein